MNNIAKLTLVAVMLNFSVYSGALEGSEMSVEYCSVKEALDAVTIKDDVEVSEQGVWVVVSDSANKTTWTFTTENAPAHPSVVKRVIAEVDGEVVVRMGVLCEAPTEACDKLVAEFEENNEEMKRSIQGMVEDKQE